MWRNDQIKISAEDVKKLPAGVMVTVHGRDRRGYSTELVCEVVHTASGKSRQLRYYDYGERMLKQLPVRALDGVVHYYTVDKDWKERQEDDG